MVRKGGFEAHGTPEWHNLYNIGKSFLITYSDTPSTPVTEHARARRLNSKLWAQLSIFWDMNQMCFEVLASYLFHTHCPGSLIFLQSSSWSKKFHIFQITKLRSKCLKCMVDTSSQIRLGPANPLGCERLLPHRKHTLENIFVKL